MSTIISAHYEELKHIGHYRTTIMQIFLENVGHYRTNIAMHEQIPKSRMFACFSHGQSKWSIGEAEHRQSVQPKETNKTGDKVAIFPSQYEESKVPFWKNWSKNKILAEHPPLLQDNNVGSRSIAPNRCWNMWFWNSNKKLLQVWWQRSHPPSLGRSVWSPL